MSIYYINKQKRTTANRNHKTNLVYLRSNFLKSGIQVQLNIGDCKNTVIFKKPTLLQSGNMSQRFSMPPLYRASVADTYAAILTLQHFPLVAMTVINTRLTKTSNFST